MTKFLSIVAMSLLSIGSIANAQVRTNTNPVAQAHVAAETAKHAKHDKSEHCDAMEKSMGTNQLHSHAEEKGTIAQTPMNRQHADCRKMMRKNKK
jgi:hypothetical protein